jgi:diaminopimelate epimerase
VTAIHKMEGSGNDFVVATGDWADRLTGDAELVRRLCDRRRGIGADGTLAVRARSESAVELVYCNADGGESSFCANGTRCAARAAVELLGCDRRLDVVTGWAVIPAEVRGTEVSLVLPEPSGLPRFPEIEVTEAIGSIARLDIGVPHLVVRVSGVADLDLPKLGPRLRHHAAVGPEGANVNFFEHGDGARIVTRTWERGVEAETLSCGSGSVAMALVVMAERGTTRVELKPVSGDTLIVEALGDPPLCPTRLTGPARFVGEVHLADEFLAGL